MPDNPQVPASDSAATEARTWNPNGSLYFSGGKLFYGQFSESGSLVQPPVGEPRKVGDFTFHLVEKEIHPDDKTPREGESPFYRAQDFPTRETTDAIIRIVKMFFPAVITIRVDGNPDKPLLWKDNVTLKVTGPQDAVGSLSVGELAFTWMDQSVDRMLSIMKDNLW